MHFLRVSSIGVPVEFFRWITFAKEMSIKHVGAVVCICVIAIL